LRIPTAACLGSPWKSARTGDAAEWGHGPVAVKRIDANTIETVQKKDGKVMMTITSKVSKDGKTRTSTWHGKNAEGKDVHNVVMFDKQ